jgi:hypothetical protein
MGTREAHLRAEIGSGKVLRTPEAAEMENAPLGIFPSYSGDESLQTGQPTTGRTASLADLLAGATLFNDSPFSPSRMR